MPLLNTTQNISTHSLTRRLTGIHLLKEQLESHFNSQPHKEADTMADAGWLNAKGFQLTASQGG